MTKQNCTLTPPFDQDTTPLYHHGIHINNPGFDLEDSFCNRLNQIRAIAGLFFTELRNEGRQLDGLECQGIHNTLEDAAEELRTICYHMLKNQEV